MRRVLTVALCAILEATVAAAAVRPDALAAVERIRGHAFIRKVDTATIARSDLPRILRQRLDEGTYPATADYTVALEALQLIGSSDKAVDGMIELYSSQVMAFYDLDEHRYYSIDSPPSGLSKELAAAPMMTGAIEVHELTHALQDQLFAAGQRAERLRYDWDAQMAYQSVLEGEATLVMLAWMGESSGLSLDQIVSSDAVIDMMAGQAATLAGAGGAERYFAESLVFPYVNGLRYIAAAYRKGGWQAVDAIDRNPPATSAEIIDPASYGPGTVRYAAPLRGSTKALLTTHFGLFNWRFLLGNAVGGWRGDLAAVYQDERCLPTVLMESHWDTEATARSVGQTYVRFLESRGIGAQTSQRGAVLRVAYGNDDRLVASFIRYDFDPLK